MYGEWHMRSSGYIIIEGNIGAGKTTFSKCLTYAIRATGCKATLLLEPVESNPFLPLYYQDPKRYAYTMQEHLLSKRYAMTQFAQWGALSDQGWFVMDRSYFGDLYFAMVQMKDGFFTFDEFRSYISSHRCMQANIHFPTAAIFLDASPVACKRRADARARDCESGLSMQYLESLDVEIARLKAFMSRMTDVIALPWENDQNEAQLKDAAQSVAEKLTKDGDGFDDFYSPWGACQAGLFEPCAQ